MTRELVRPRRLGIDPRWEADFRQQGYARVAGVDEAGRGCLFGPVVAAAVILADPHGLRGVNDSKQLEEAEREALFEKIVERAVAWSVASVDAATIDRINILEASRLAMALAVGGLRVGAEALLIDALLLDLPQPQKGIIHGDAVCRSIAAASIVAKVYRDRIMREWDRLHPGFAFSSNKGYGTPSHLRALRTLGPTAEHRFSYRPVKECCLGAQGVGWQGIGGQAIARQDPQQLLF